MRERAERSFVESIVVKIQAAVSRLWPAGLAPGDFTAPMACQLAGWLLEDDGLPAGLEVTMWRGYSPREQYITQEAADLLKGELPMRAGDALFMHKLPGWEALGKRGGFTDHLRWMVYMSYFKSDVDDTPHWTTFCTNGAALVPESDCAAYLVVYHFLGSYGRMGIGHRLLSEGPNGPTEEAFPQHEKKSCFADYQRCVQCLREAKRWPRLVGPN